MSSLLQHRPLRYSSRAIWLAGYLTEKVRHTLAHGEQWYETDEPTEWFTCDYCGRQHEVLYEFWRVPCGMMGCWVIFRWYGTTHVPDLSVPIRLDKGLPKGAKRLTQREMEAHWHDLTPDYYQR